MPCPIASVKTRPYLSGIGCLLMNVERQCSRMLFLGKNMGDDIHNVIIIGSGPAGYTAGLYAARAMLEPLMFAGYMSGGQLMLTSDVENFPGYPKGIGGPEMMMELREQAERFGLEVEDQKCRNRRFIATPFKVVV